MVPNPSQSCPTVVVTGCCGRLGRGISNHLVVAGFAVRGIDRSPRPTGLAAAVTHHQTSLSDLSAVADVLAGCTVLHVTGDPWEATRLADRIVVLEGPPAGIQESETPPGSPPRLADQPGVVECAEALLSRLMRE